MKKIFLTFLLFFLICFNSFVFAKAADSKNYKINADNLYMISLTVLNNLNYKIEEMQSTSGYILFKTNNEDEYLLVVTSIGEEASNVKITKLKQTSPLIEIQNAIYNEIANNLSNIPVKAE